MASGVVGAIARSEKTRAREKLLSGASGLALASVAAAVAVGVSLPGPALAAPNMTVNPGVSAFAQVGPSIEAESVVL